VPERSKGWFGAVGEELLECLVELEEEGEEALHFPDVRFCDKRRDACGVGSLFVRIVLIAQGAIVFVVRLSVLSDVILEALEVVGGGFVDAVEVGLEPRGWFCCVFRGM
jgi:hypothetical protein